MNTREIIPFPQSLKLTLTLPGSKSITNRALLCAALARGTSRIRGALFSDDTLVMLKALRRLGITIKTHKNNAIAVTGNGGQFHSRKLKFALGNAGTATRFLTAIMSVRKGQTIITGNERMQQRPIGDLVDGLRQMGAQIDYCKKDGFPPLTIKACVSPTQQPTYVVKIKGDKSSQYFSALLILGSLLDRPLQLHVIGDLVSKPYINTTIAVMKAFGVRVKNNNYRSFVVKPQTYKVCDYEVEGDASAGSYWSSINYLHSGHLIFSNLNKKSVQGDVNYPNALGQLGKGKVDMNAMPDSAMTLAITAPFVKGKTQITGLGNLRIKETDRLKALQTELRKVGATVSITKSSITIEGSLKKPKSVLIKTYDDHRMAMCFAVMGTKIPGLVIGDPECTHKTYPHFWKDLELAYLSPIRLGKKNLVLTGMRAVGKSFYGKKIAKMLGRTLVDLDLEIEKMEGMTIPEMVKKYGWPHFRKIEQKICSIYGASKESLIIATGGGVVLYEKNMKALKKNGIVVFIYADSQTLLKRRKTSGARPPLHPRHNGMAEINKVWHARRYLYLKTADYVWDDTSGEVVKRNLKNIFFV